jgi:hypothetical protein
MITQTIQRILSEIETTKSISSEKREELLKLINTLKSEVDTLDKSHSADLKSMATYTESTLHEATKDEIDEELLKHSLEGMAISVRKFEVSHPKMVGLINTIGQRLADIGI